MNYYVHYFDSDNNPCRINHHFSTSEEAEEYGDKHLGHMLTWVVSTKAQTQIVEGEIYEIKRNDE